MKMFLDCSNDNLYCDTATSRVFGVDLIELTKLERSPIPLFVERVIDYLEHHGTGYFSILFHSNFKIRKHVEISFS
jgi:hypothetical protein